MIARQENDIRQSGRVLELQNNDLWIRPTDLSWHFPIRVTTRELPFKKFRGRSPTKWKAREDKILEAKKQKTPKNEDQEWNSGRWKSSFLDLEYSTLIFCRARMELRQDA